jgi:succinate dehydrogenase/fumarate reductase flavoprotein subunit
VNFSAQTQKDHWPVLVIGADMASLVTALSLADKGCAVSLVVPTSLIENTFPVVNALNAQLGLVPEDSEQDFLKDTFLSAAGLGSSSLMTCLVKRSPEVVNLCERLGIDFARTKEGFLQQSLSHRHQRARTLFSSSVPLSQQIHRALVSQVVLAVSQGRLSLYKESAFVSLLKDTEGHAVGVVLQNLQDMTFSSHFCKAVVLGGESFYQRFSFTPMQNWRGLNALVYREGVALRNPEFGFLDKDSLNFSGGMWVDDQFQTTVPGVYVVGQLMSGFHGADVLPGNFLLAEFVSGLEAATVLHTRLSSQALPKESVFLDFQEQAQALCARCETEFLSLLDQEGAENLSVLWEEFLLTLRSVLVFEKTKKSLQEGQKAVCALKDRFQRVSLFDSSLYLNQEAVFAREFSVCLDLAEAVLVSAYLREESRGLFFRRDFPQENQERFFRETKVFWDERGPQVFYAEPTFSPSFQVRHHHG